MVTVAECQTAAEGELIAVLESIKMEQPLKSHKSGPVVGLRAEIGQSISSRAVLFGIQR